MVQRDYEAAVPTMIYTLVLIWIIGAVLCIKANATLIHSPTEYWADLPQAIVAWPIIAILICTTRHLSFTDGRYESREYHY